MLAIVAPGQGSQSPGMLTEWLENADSLRKIEQWSRENSLDLATFGSTATAEEIKNTAIAQPLIVAAGLLSIAALGEAGVSALSGHSVGEITAAAISGVLSESDSMKLVCERGRAMADAASGETGMSAVLGGEREAVLSAIAACGLVAANENGAGQIVAAGLLSGLAQLSENPPEGARVRALAVAGAFHTPFMAPARTHIERFASGIAVHDPRITLLSNVDGEVVSEGEQVLARIIQQIANPVRWDLCMATIAKQSITGVIELAPGGTLIGLFKRAFPEIETIAIKTPADISAAREFAKRHAATVVA